MKRSSSIGAEARVKAVKKAEDKPAAVDETDSAIGSDLEYEDDFADEFEHEEIVDAQYEDVEVNFDDEEAAAATADKTANTPAPSVFRPGIDQLEPGQVLEPEPGTYKMLHRLEVQWPCLSFDILPDALGDKRSRFPMTAYVVSGTQADNAEKNKLIVMKWANLHKTSKDGIDEEDEEENHRRFRLEEDSDDSDDENDQEPELEFRMLKHAGGVNRVRAMPQMGSLVASWSDNSSVYVYNVHAELEALEGRGNPAAGSQKPVHAFSGHSTEGFAMGWNPHQVGQLVTGDCAGGCYMWEPASGGTWTQSAILKSAAKSFSSIEDIEFRRAGDNCANIFAICGGEAGKVGIVDVRNSAKVATEFVAHKGDTNVLSWNPIVGQLLLTGGDDGTFKVWDVRATSRGALANFKWHREAITSVDWHPVDEAVLAVSSADDTTSIWDMSVEEDLAASADAQGAEYYPPQLLFLHMGQKSVKEIKFHKQMPGVVVSTAFDGFNIFKTFNIA